MVKIIIFIIAFFITSSIIDRIYRKKEIAKAVHLKDEYPELVKLFLDNCPKACIVKEDINFIYISTNGEGWANSYTIKKPALHKLLIHVNLQFRGIPGEFTVDKTFEDDTPQNIIFERIQQAVSDVTSEIKGLADKQNN